MLPLHPFPHPHRKGIALVSDSAHLMTPFAGKGVNTAMADGHNLAKQLEQLVSSSSSEVISEDGTPTRLAQIMACRVSSKSSRAGMSQ